MQQANFNLDETLNKPRMRMFGDLPKACTVRPTLQLVATRCVTGHGLTGFLGTSTAANLLSTQMDPRARTPR